MLMLRRAGKPAALSGNLGDDIDDIHACPLGGPRRRGCDGRGGAGFGAGLTWASCIMKWAKEDN